MTTDGSSLRVVAVGNHRTGYHGSVEIEEYGRSSWSWRCHHRHDETREARNCARRSIRIALGARREATG